MGFARKDVEATKKMEKKFVRYPEGAEKHRFRIDKISGISKRGESSL